MPLRGVGKARDPGGGSCSLSSTTSSSRRQCDGGGRSGLFSNCDSFISSVSCLLCQPPFWGCQSRPKLVPQEAEAAKAKGSRCHKRFLLALLAQAHPPLGGAGW